MSNLFESLTKAELIKAEDFALPVTASPEAEQAKQVPVATNSAPASHSVQTTSILGGAETNVRTARLRVSALSPIFPFEHDNHAAGEQYRIIRTKILHHPRQPRVVVVSSGSSGDGKTITSINVAASLALKKDLKIALIDGDMRRPQISNLLGLDGTPGLGEVLGGTATFAESAICPEQFPNLCILPAGSPQHAQAELLDSERWHTLLAFLRKQFDYIIIDAPPIATVTDYELLQIVSDGVLLVARPDHSNRNTCLKALKTVPKEKFLGVVLNCVEDWFLSRSHTYAYYSQTN
jgi:capsular exopolysaccharide synthesis family protein